VAALTHLPHLAGDLLAAILLGGGLGAVFAVCRLVSRRLTGTRRVDW